MAQIVGFEELALQLEEVAESFDRMKGDPTGATSRTVSAKDAIADGIEKAMENKIVPEAKANAPEGTLDDHHGANDAEGERAGPGHLRRSIDHERIGWAGDSYGHRYGSTSPYEYVKVQEFGTTKQNYLITPNGDYPLRFEVGGFEIAVEYVVHPGVEGKHFMRNALKRNTNTIQGYVGNEIRELLKREFR